MNGATVALKEVKMLYGKQADIEECVKQGLAEFRKEARVIFGASVLTRRNFLCCGGCASSALVTEWEEKGKKAVGSVYYTQQTAADYRKGGDLWFNYGSFDAVGDCSRDLMTSRIGDLFAERMRMAGCEVEWNGDIRQRIRILGAKSLTAERNAV